MNKTKAKEITRNWRTLTNELGNLHEDELWILLQWECKYGKRKSFIERIHSAYCEHRWRREREQLLEEVG